MFESLGNLCIIGVIACVAVCCPLSMFEGQHTNLSRLAGAAVILAILAGVFFLCDTVVDAREQRRRR